MSSYGTSNVTARSGRRSELPTVDRSPSRKPDHGSYYEGAPYYGREDELASPIMMDERSRHHRSRSASRPAQNPPSAIRYQSLDRAGVTDDREFAPIREPRDRSRERPMYLEDDLYGAGRSARQSPNPHTGNMYISELQQQNNDLQRELATFKKELDLTNQKLGSSMHSIKTFWSPELKKERALRKEESAKYSLINDQLKLLNSENQKQSMLVRQLEEELRILRMKNPSIELQQQIELLFAENEHLTREIAILRETIKELELRIETQKQTLAARDESIKKLLEMLQNKGVGGKMVDEDRMELEARLIESEAKALHFETLVRERGLEMSKTKSLEEFRAEIQRRDQEILAMNAKMKTLEEQHQDYQRHIAVLKESLCAKEEHYNMLQADVEELRQRLEEKNRLIEKKTLAATQAIQEKNRIYNEYMEMKDHTDIKDRKINVLQRKLELHETNRKLVNGAAKAGEETTALKMQLEEQKKQLEDQRRQLEELKRGLDSKSRQLDEKEKAITEADLKLKKRKEKLDNLEAQLQKQGTVSAQSDSELRRRYTELEKEIESLHGALEKAHEDAQASHAEVERLLKLMQMSQEEQNMKEKTIRDLQESLKNAQAKMRSQQAAAAQKEEESVRIAELEQDVRDLQDVLLEHTKKEDAESERAVQLESRLTEVEGELYSEKEKRQEKEGRIEELEEALRQSVAITAERERVLSQEETRRRDIMEKVGKLEQRLLSLQTAHALRCSTCRPLLTRVQDMEGRLTRLLAERREHLRDLANMKREALEAAISEKDAHLALLEVSGIRTVRQSEEAEKLKSDRKRLMEKLKEESEKIVQLIQEYSETNSDISLPTSSEDMLNEESLLQSEENGKCPDVCTLPA